LNCEDDSKEFQFGFRPQYVDYSCLDPVLKIRLYSGVILITYQIYLGILFHGDKLQVSQVRVMLEISQVLHQLPKPQYIV